MFQQLSVAGDAKASWRKGSKVRRGCWVHLARHGMFWVCVRKAGGPVAGMFRHPFHVTGDRPEWNGWALVDDAKVPKQPKKKQKQLGLFDEAKLKQRTKR